ncbi:hypothetical protein ACHAXN_000433 [Cyclotella atomus]
MLSPYPLELVSFESLDSPDNQFSQINRPISKDPFIEAGLKGFAPVEPFKLPATNKFLWPSAAELNEELFPFPWLPDESDQLLSSQDSIESAPVFMMALRPQHQTLLPLQSWISVHSLPISCAAITNCSLFCTLLATPIIVNGN